MDNLLVRLYMHAVPAKAFQIWCQLHRIVTYVKKLGIGLNSAQDGSVLRVVSDHVPVMADSTLGWVTHDIDETGVWIEFFYPRGDARHQGQLRVVRAGLSQYRRVSC